MKYPPLAFSPVNLCKADVFTLNMMALYHKRSQTINNNKNTKLLKKYFYCMNERKAEIQEKMNIN